MERGDEAVPTDEGHYGGDVCGEEKDARAPDERKDGLAAVLEMEGGEAPEELQADEAGGVWGGRNRE